MADRRAKFESQFRNVWSTGPTGVSLVQFSTESIEGAEQLITRLFRKTLIADVEEYKSNMNRAFLSAKGVMVPIINMHKIVMVTSDDRVAELIEEVAANDPNHWNYPPFDMVVVPLATGSKEYITWVKHQTLKRDASTAFFNEQINDPLEPLNNEIPSYLNNSTNRSNSTYPAAHELMQLPGKALNV
jgi:uncharacterized protein involved in tolerance to divalent cations